LNFGILKILNISTLKGIQSNLNAYLSLLSIILPQLLYELGANEIARIRRQHAQYKQSVTLQVVVHKVAYQIAFEFVHLQVGRLGRCGLEIERILVAPQQRLSHYFNATRDVTLAFQRQKPIRPHAQTVNVYAQDQRVPKPNEREYLLIEQVYGQHALYRVAMAHFWVAHFAYLKVAHAYFGKNARARIPSLTTPYLVHKLKAKLVKLMAQQQIEHKQL